MPALVGGPAPVVAQAVTAVTAFFFDVVHVKRVARGDAAIAWAFAEAPWPADPPRHSSAAATRYSFL